MPTVHHVPTTLERIAHRGASGAAPENTLAAVESALRQHATAVEVDVHRTRDGELVVMHDPTLERTTDVRRVLAGRAPWRVADATLEQIRRLDAGAWFDARFAGERVPTLREVLEVVGDRAGVLVEVKRPDHYPGIAADVVAVLRDAGGRAPVVVQSFDPAFGRALHDAAPDVPVGMLFRRPPAPEELPALRGWASQVNVSRHVADAALVDEVHALGMTTRVYTPNTPELMRWYAGLGVDGIITDHPGLLRDTLAVHPPEAASPRVA